MALFDERSTTLALLGPTNTGKTHRAVERMLEHDSGMMGLPLRLLAREIYDRITPRVGERAVALVTGEEKRIPAGPRYWICTVESMPVTRDVDFLAVDEVQLAAHRQRGHVFTDRLLHARGRRETWFMGSDTIRPIVEQLVPTAEIARHPRMSKLSGGAASGLSGLPPRSAVIAFSAAEVYRLADKLRRRRGGAAVVLGALSPRTRNAQVAMYQAGEVDFLVATDAVGMGLNMDVDHVAFAALHKFDGVRRRMLSPAELAQIAGRAGRHTRDGTFGTLSPLELPPELVFAIESHRFAPVKRVMWRNSDVDTSSLDALLASLSERPKRAVLTMIDRTPDLAALQLLSQRPQVRDRARSPETVALLWDVCRIPDFRKLMLEHHANLLEELFVQLSSDSNRIDHEFMHERIGRLETADGDIDTLMMRMELLRTWNYIAHHQAWVGDAEAWQQRTQRAEDRLSQALHERLIDRFVEQGRKTTRGRARKGASKSARKAKAAATAAQSSRRAERVADGPFAQLAALRDAMSPPPAEPGETVADWVEELVEAPHERLAVDAQSIVSFVSDDGRIELGRLMRGVDALHPEIKLSLPPGVGAGAQMRVLRRLRAWVRDLVDELMQPLRDERSHALSSAGRGLIYQLEKHLGTVEEAGAREQLRTLTAEDRTLLRELGVKLGRRFVYLPALVTPDAVRRRVALCSAFHGVTMDDVGDAPSLRAKRRVGAEHYRSIGFPVFGPRAIRADVVERVSGALSSAASQGPFTPPPQLQSWIGCDDGELGSIVLAFGYHETHEGFIKPKKRRRRRRR